MLRGRTAGAARHVILRERRGASPPARCKTCSTPTLRALSARAPYFHNGIASTLEDVVRHPPRDSSGLRFHERGTSRPGSLLESPLKTTRTADANVEKALASWRGATPTTSVEFSPISR